MAVVVHKRHLVLYSWIALSLLVALAISLWMMFRYLSFIRADQQTAQSASTTEARTPTIIQSLLSTAGTPQAASTAFAFEIAGTPAEQERGLGGRAVIPADYGMLFVFPKDDTYGFWMKDMEAPIDMLWLSDSGEVVYALTNVSPSTYPTVFYPASPARYVLETRAGESVRKGWTAGAKVPLPPPYGN